MTIIILYVSCIYIVLYVSVKYFLLGIWYLGSSVQINDLKPSLSTIEIGWQSVAIISPTFVCIRFALESLMSHTLRSSAVSCKDTCLSRVPSVVELCFFFSSVFNLLYLSYNIPLHAQASFSNGAQGFVGVNVLVLWPARGTSMLLFLHLANLESSATLKNSQIGDFFLPVAIVCALN